MARLKYAPGVTPIKNEHKGYTFQSGRAANSALIGQKNDRERNARQSNRQVNLMRCTSWWRLMSTDCKNAWNAFASTYPQKQKKDPLKFLSGYQLFLKRNHYLFLNYGIEEPFMEAPLMHELAPPAAIFSIEQLNNCVDVTELYIMNFGILPKAGDTVLFLCLPMSVNSGQFFPPIRSQLEIIEVYIDGMFLSVTLPPTQEHIIFSVYLSAPVNQSVNYTGTKIRYMGCFTTKTFLDLSDTPDSYEDQSLKLVRVKEDQTGLEFFVPNTGGLSCETLPLCPTIVTINSQIINIILAMIECGCTSIFASKKGGIYNFYAVTDIRNIAPFGFHVASISEYFSLMDELGAAGDYLFNEVGGMLKEEGTSNWSSPNEGATNETGFTALGVGSRTPDGVFTLVHETAFFCTTSVAEYNPLNYEMFRLTYYEIAASHAQDRQRFGASLRFIANSGAPTIAVGNDGKVYPCVTIGSQTWTAANSNETKYQNGDWIHGFDGGVYTPISIADWAAITTEAMCYYNDIVV